MNPFAVNENSLFPTGLRSKVQILSLVSGPLHTEVDTTKPCTAFRSKNLDIPFELIDFSHPNFSSTLNSARNLVQQRRAERIVTTIIREIDGPDPVRYHGTH